MVLALLLARCSLLRLWLSVNGLCRVLLLPLLPVLCVYEHAWCCCSSMTGRHRFLSSLQYQPVRAAGLLLLLAGLLGVWSVPPAVAAGSAAAPAADLRAAASAA